MPKQLTEQPPIPAVFKNVWEWFTDLRNAAGCGEFGPKPIGYVDIAAWSQLLSIDISPCDVRAIKTIDNIFINFQASKK